MRARHDAKAYRDERSALERAISVVGTQAAIARFFNITETSITHWKLYGIPGERVLALEKLTGGKVTRHELRPDLYPRD